MKKIIFKYVKQLQKNTLICPSEINFLNESEFQIDDNLLNELNNKIDTLNKEQYPKLQVTQRDGHYFALNNTMLFLFQNLEQKRKVDKIYCELISLDKIPLNLQKEMILNNVNNNFKSSSESFESCCSESCSECLQNNTITTMISNTLNNQINQNLNIPENEQTLILKDDLSLTSSLSTSDLDLDDFDRNRRVSIIVCNYCDQKFSNSKLLRKHKLRKKHFVCTICSEKFKNQIKLENHKQTNEHWSDNE